MTHRLLALLGSIAFGISQLVGSLLSFAGLRELARYAVPVLVAALAAAAILSARDTAAILASRPEVQETTLADASSRDEISGSIWFEFDAVMAATHLATPADLGTFFYLARDPDDPTTGLLVRSGLNDAFIRRRVLVAELVEDPAVVASAREQLRPLPGGFDVETTRYLREVQAGGDPESAFIPSELAAEDAGSELTVTGRVVTPITHSACVAETGCDGEDAEWLYYLADPEGAGAIVLRSTHPPDAIPVRLQGLYARDSFDLRPVLESDWYAELDAEVPTDRAFAAGSRPPIVQEASWVPTIVFAAIGVVLLASFVVGYPVFGGRVAPRPARSLAPGEAVDVEITGRLVRPVGGQGALSLDRSPGAVERLSIADLALRMWRYGLLPRDLSRREAEQRFVAEAAGDRDRLIVHERDQSALVIVDHDPAAVRVDAGRLYRISGSAPAVHFRQGGTDAYLVVRGAEVRDRLAAEIRGELERRAQGEARPAAT